MPGPYQTVTERGDRWPENRRLHVLVYPNTPAEVAATTVGETIPAALTHGADQLFDAGAISYYRLQRFPAEQAAYSYPRLGPDELDTGFQGYLRGTADEFSDRSWCTESECDPLTAYRGVHLLVHGHGLEIGLADAEADGCDQGGTAFSRGAAAWTGTADGDDEGLARNSAIHETLHLCIRASLDDVNALFCDADGDGERSAYEEHTLGEITADGAVTPMLTYHVDEHAGCRGPAPEWDGSYTPELTDRTKAAVGITAANQCRPQPGVTEWPPD